MKSGEANDLVLIADDGGVFERNLGERMDFKFSRDNI
jgi:hypothetical protein